MTISWRGESRNVGLWYILIHSVGATLELAPTDSSLNEKEWWFNLDIKGPKALLMVIMLIKANYLCFIRRFGHKHRKYASKASGNKHDSILLYSCMKRKVFPSQARCGTTSNARCHQSPATSLPLTLISQLQSPASFHLSPVPCQPLFHCK